MKKFFAILLACALIFSTLPVMAFAEDAVEDEIISDLQCACENKEAIEAEKEFSVAANCMSVAYDVYLCGDCGLHYTRVTGGKDASNHVGIRNVEAKAPTCTEDGYEAYWECYYMHGGEVQSCGANNKVVLPATGHDYVANVTPPTCDAEGYTTYTCAACGDSYVADYVDATGHDYVATVTPPTCDADGYTTYTCAACGDSFVDDYVDATGHDYVATVTPPTCDADGYTTYTCAACGDSFVDDYVDATGHTWTEVSRVDADCYVDGVIYYECECGETREEVIPAPMNHTYIVTEIPATCTEGAKLKHVCDVCGTELVIAKEGSTALGHDFGDWVVTTNPDCVNEGEETRECSRCDAFETQPVAALGHTEEAIPAVAPTCTETGLTEGTKCSVCDTILVAQEVVDALGHTPEEIPMVPDTCISDGLTAGSKCSVCGVILVAQEVIPADPKDHVTSVVSPRVEATCMTPGHTHTVICTECGETIAHPQEIPIDPNAHALSGVVTAPTCEAQGYTTYTCDHGCGYTTIGDYVDALGHNYEAVVTAPDCVNGGYTTYTCTNDSSHTYVADYVDALGHDLSYVDAQAPDCVNIGWNAYEYCNVCDYTTYVELPALGHTEGAAVVENNVLPDCVTEGSYDSVVYCSVCDAELSRETVIVDALGHTLGETAGTVYPTCTERGYDICVCLVCDEIYMDSEGEHHDALGHTEGDVVVENNVAPDCVNGGSYDNVVYCSVCDAELSRETVTVDALGHTEGDVVVENNVAPDCVNGGSYDNVVYCSVCDAELSRETVTVDALGHTEVVDDAVAPDCVNTGLTVGSHCDVCGETIIAQEVIPALGHTEVADEAVNPDCLNTGLTAGSHCDVCGETIIAQEVIPALGHTSAIDEYLAPTFDTTGLTAGTHCSVCGEVLVAQNEIPTLNEMITFSYVVKGINGSANATNSGLVYLTVYVTVDELYADVIAQARLWGVDLEIEFGDCVNLVNATGSMFPVFLTTQYDEANAANSVKITTTMSLTQPENSVFTAGTHELAVLTFKVADGYFQQDVNFNVAQCDVIRNEEANDLTIDTGILENVEEGVDLPEATIYVAMLGDANLDGVITGSDSLSMSIWATSEENANDVNAYDTVYDMNKDGIINGLDFLLLGKAVVGDDEYLG